MPKKKNSPQRKPIYLPLPKRPRQYALEIAALPTKAARVKALAMVPEEIRAITKIHVLNYWARK